MKFLVVEYGVKGEELLPITVDGCSTECVAKFTDSSEW